MRSLIPTSRWRLRPAPSLSGPCSQSVSAEVVSLANADRLFLALLLILSSGLLVGAVRAVPPERLAPVELSKLEVTALCLFDDAQRGDWRTAEQHLRTIGVVAEPVLTRLNAANAPLARAILRSARAIRDHDRAGAEHGANKIMEWAAQTEAPTHLDMPPQIARLDYLVREIQIEAENDIAEKLARRVAQIRACWDQLRPTLEVQGDTATIQEGEKLIQQLELALAPADLVPVQTPLSRLMERVRNAFGSAGQ